MGIKSLGKIDENIWGKWKNITNLKEWVDFFDYFFYEIKCKILFALKDELGMVKGKWQVEINIHKDFIEDIDYISKEVFKTLLNEWSAESWDSIVCKIKDKQLIN